MTFRCTLRLILFMTLISLLAGCREGGKRPAMKIGFMVCNSEKETMQRFVPLTRYLSDKTGVDFIAVPVDTQDFERRFKAGEFALAHSNSLIYIILKERFGLQLIASEKRGQFGSRTAGAIIARAGSGVARLSDIRGKKMAFGPMMAPTGYLAEYDMMLKAGLDPERDLANYSIPAGSYKHEKAIYGVLYGKYDVAAAPVLDLEVLTREGKIAPEDFVVLARSQLVPYCTFGAARDADPGIVRKIRQALLELKADDTAEVDGERVKVLKAAGIDGYEELLDSDYDPIRDMARRVNMPPYQKY
ncbi:MAG TPA: phosphate/phosphite/phosphonate ABC transporter substrate-binding protein [Desulfuromonadaceae bacterium]